MLSCFNALMLYIDKVKVSGGYSKKPRMNFQEGKNTRTTHAHTHRLAGMKIFAYKNGER
jgi:hypothetical protein